MVAASVASASKELCQEKRCSCGGVNAVVELANLELGNQLETMTPGNVVT